MAVAGPRAKGLAHLNPGLAAARCDKPSPAVNSCAPTAHAAVARLPKLCAMNADPSRHPAPTPIWPRARAPSLVFIAFVLGAGALSSAAQAQAVRKCQVDGRVVFQSSPCAIELRAAAPVASTPPPAAPIESAGAPKKKTLAELLRERDGNDRVRTSVREPQDDGAAVLRSRMGAV